MTATTLGALPLGPIQFNEPVWLWLIPITWALAFWWGRGGISGLGTPTRRVALGVRAVVLALLAGAMAEPQLRDEARDMAVAVVMDVSKSIPAPLQRQADQYIQDAADTHMGPTDELGIITMAQDAYVQRLPSKLTKQVERNVIGATEGTNLAGGVRLALAVRPTDAAYRIVIATDGNETAGSLLQEAEAAKAAGIPIDVLPLKFRNDREVIVEELIAPTTARMGENINLKVRVTATRDTPGRMNILINGEPLDLDPEGPDLGWSMMAQQGTHVYTVPTTVPRAGAQQFEAVFEAAQTGAGGAPPGDAITENNRALAVTFVSGEGKVLIFAQDAAEPEQLIEALARARIDARVVKPEEGPRNLTELAAFDCLVLCNVPAYAFSEKAMEEMRQYVHDGGGGMIMVGGPDSFGAGGWIGTPVEDALPIRLDPPQKRKLPRGALVLVIHSVEMPQGVHYGKKTAEAAVDALTRLDLVGINEYRGGTSNEWVLPLSEVGDKVAAKQAINRLVFGDMPSFDPSLQMALSALSKAEAGKKHVIMISDGDPSVSNSILAQFAKAQITISTVGVFPHGGNDLSRMKQIADATKGKYYAVTTTAQLANLPQIFFNEAQLVRRPLIWEGEPFLPAVQAVPVETMRGIPGVPPITGYVVGADREGLSIVTIRGKENDPVAAQWQYGLGRVVAFTSDAATRWATQWAQSNVFQAFWEQHLRWAMRASGDARIRVVTENQGDETRVIVEATDPQGERLNFASIRGRVALPDGGAEDLELQQVGPGRYEGRIKTRLFGSYVASLKYLAPNPAGGKPLEGTVLAAVARPFADEYRALEDNTALLHQVANTTGGRILPGDPRSPESDLWLRDGLRMPVALTPIWQHAALCAIGLFLVDVGVRRVRVDFHALASAALGVFRKGRQRTGQQMASLREAREKARLRMGERGAGEAAASETPLPAVQPGIARAKFEASPAQLSARRTEPIALKGEPERDKPREPDGPKTPEEGGLGRLMKAKKRAQEGFEKEQSE